MQAIEFSEQLYDGIIKLPSQFQDWNNRQVRVILLAEKIKQTLPKTIEKDSYSFNAVSLKTKGFRFNREEANER